MALPAPEKYLLFGEHVDYVTHRHGVVLVRPAALAFGVLLLESILFGITFVNVVTLVGLLVTVFLIGRLGWKILAWRVEATYITDWRVFEVSGLLTQKVAAIPIRKITDLTYETSTTGRVLGYARFHLETAGQDQALSRLDYIPRPRKMYEILSHLMLHGSLNVDRTAGDSDDEAVSASTFADDDD